MYWNEKPYHSLDYEMKRIYGHKIYKLALDGGMTCPNRDGTLGTDGCIFCSGGGSGEFAESLSAHVSVTEQIEAAKARVEKKMEKNQARSFTGISQRPLHCLFPVLYKHVRADFALKGAVY